MLLLLKRRSVSLPRKIYAPQLGFGLCSIGGQRRRIIELTLVTSRQEINSSKHLIGGQDIDVGI